MPDDRSAVVVRDVEVRANFEGEDYRFTHDMDRQGVTIRAAPCPGQRDAEPDAAHPRRSVTMTWSDFDRLAAEVATFRRISAEVVSPALPFFPKLAASGWANNGSGPW